MVAHSSNFLNSQTTDFATAGAMAGGKAGGEIGNNEGIPQYVSYREYVRDKCDGEGGMILEVE